MQFLTDLLGAIALFAILCIALTIGHGLNL
jgi:hypothetical protein